MPDTFCQPTSPMMVQCKCGTMGLPDESPHAVPLIDQAGPHELTNSTLAFSPGHMDILEPIGGTKT